MVKAAQKSAQKPSSLKKSLKIPPNKKPGPKTEIEKKFVDRIVKSRTFEPLEKPTVGCRFWRPKRKGESVTGVIGMPITNFRCATSYPFRLVDTGELIEVLGNRQLHKLIKQADCYGQLVEIVYQGRQYTHAGHYRKIYRLYKIKWSDV